MLFERCHNCKDRHYLCHSNCEHYERACQKKEMQKKMKRLESLANDSNYKSWGYHRKEKKINLVNKHTLLKRIRTHRHWLVIMLIFIMQGIILFTAYKEHAEYTKPTFEANKIEYIGYSDINQLHTYRLDGDVYITSHELITISIDGENEFIRDGETIMMPKTFPLAKSKELTWKSYGNKDDELRFVTIQRTLINAEKLNDKTEVNKDVEIRPISIKKVPLSIDEIIQRINRLTGE